MLLLANLVDGTGATVPNLTNTLIVENVINTSERAVRAGLSQVTSNVGGTIAAVGHRRVLPASTRG